MVCQKDKPILYVIDFHAKMFTGLYKKFSHRHFSHLKKLFSRSLGGRVADFSWRVISIHSWCWELSLEDTGEVIFWIFWLPTYATIFVNLKTCFLLKDVSTVISDERPDVDWKSSFPHRSSFYLQHSSSWPFLSLSFHKRLVQTHEVKFPFSLHFLFDLRPCLLVSSGNQNKTFLMWYAQKKPHHLLLNLSATYHLFNHIPYFHDFQQNIPISFQKYSYAYSMHIRIGPYHRFLKTNPGFIKSDYSHRKKGKNACKQLRKLTY